jgi:hypothetical protein
VAPWNLTDRMSRGAERYFHLPVASDPTGGADRPAVAHETYLIEEGEADGFPHLGVAVEDPPGATTGDPLLAAAVRLHAMGEGWLSYRPQRGAFRQCLILDLPPIWFNVAARAPWFERWIEADCLPRTVVYDNVDLAHLRGLLEATPVSPTTGFRLSYPASVTRNEITKADFIDRFLAGEPGHAMFAGRGAAIGRMDRMPGHPTLRRLRLRAFYQDHSDDDPRPMLPRELFNLLFGIDSPEFAGHPLLRAVHEVGEGDVETVPRSLRMLLRPPLRTHARVIWEAEQELAAEALSDTKRWRKSGSLGRTKLLNAVDGFNRDGTYKDKNKCNVFVGEMLVRSGFRARMHPFQGNLVYSVVNWVAEDARHTAMTVTEPGLLGFAGQIPWGRRWDGVFATKPFDQMAPLINHMIREEGRTFYLVQEFLHPESGVWRSGHMLLLEAVHEMTPGGAPTVRWEGLGRTKPRGASTTPDSYTQIGLWGIVATVVEAPSSGLRRRVEAMVVVNWPEVFRDNTQSKAEASQNNDLLLIEALPGRDPGTPAGYQDLSSIGQR